MPGRNISRIARPVVESLEGRALLSGSGLTATTLARSALVRSIRSSIQTDPAGVAAILNALNGGLGSEWTKLLRSQVRNLNGVLARFVSGQLTAYSTPGFAVRTPGVQSLFVGQPYDQLLPQVAGAAVFKNNIVELGAIMRGPFHDPSTTYYQFALDRGAGASLGPIFAARPKITPDTIVTLTVAPFGTSATGTITDLTTGASQAIDPSKIQIRGPVIRVFLNASQLPSHGFKLAKYRFAFWTQIQPGRDISTVASFLPDAGMIPISVQKRIAVTV
ncbi:hypothetical protein [Aquisphaera insulae]|uniref:hypothetical protein n=1 Tax=Aquisphaera insulae TaxID=2712864 RepID=UPI0013EDF638|nr:hypothetical protein [Aquisphaera insulae]